MIERDFQSEFSKFMQDGGAFIIGLSIGAIAFELKLSKTKSIRFDAVAEHQRDALIKVKTCDGLYHKITDQPWIKDRPYSYTAKKPFDCFVMRGEAYVVVMFWEPRVKKMVYFIDVDEWIRAEKESAKKSITEAGCVDIAKIILDFKSSKIIRS